MRRLLFLLCALAAVLPVQGRGVDPLYRRFPVKQLVKTPCEPVSVSSPAGGVLFADFGRAAFGQLRLEAELPCGSEVTVHLGESALGGRVNRNPGGSVRYCRYALHLEAGKHSYALELVSDPRNTRRTPTSSGTLPILMPDYIGEVYPFRYCEIEGLPDGAAVRLVRDDVHYPFNDSASDFHCSDSVLNKVWDLCKYSVKATSFAGVYVDGDRERIPYEADALINQLSHYGVDAEYSIARRTAEYLFEHPTWPTEWHLQMVSIAWYDYLYTGDKALIRKYYEILKRKTLSALRMPNGLISTRTGLLTEELCRDLNYSGKDPIKDIVDWPRSGSFGIDKKEAGEADGYVLTDYNTAVNAWHYESLVLMSRIARALGRRSDARGFERDAAAVRDAVNALLFDASAGCYRDGLDTGHHSLHANMFPLAFGMVPEEHRGSVIDFIRSRGMACSVYGAQFLLDGLFDAGEDAYALSLMASTGRRSWYNMLRIGSTVTLEAWDPVFKSNLDWNHAWGSAPANVIPRKLMGIEPLEPGFRRFRVMPRPGGLESASALVPTVLGGIGCAFENGESFKLDLDVPSGARAEVWLPVAGGHLYVNGKSRSYRFEEGFAVFRLGRGEWKCEIK